MKEIDLYSSMKKWFQNQGYEVRPEMSILYRSFDAVAEKDGIVIAIEMKLSLTKGLLNQIRRGDLFADFSYIVISTKPKKESENLSLCLGCGIGILSVRNGIVQELYSPLRNNNYVELYHQRAIDFIKNTEDTGVGGQPWLKGQGPAQAVERMIIAYRKNNPDVTWRELYKKIPNHYSSYRSMQGAMAMLQERRAWQEMEKEKRKR